MVMRKPAKWAFDKSQVDDEWDWFHEMAVFVAPLWSGGGSPYDVVNMLGVPQATSPLTWERPALGWGLRGDAVSEGAQVTAPENLKLSLPITVCMGVISLANATSSTFTFGVAYNKPQTNPWLAYGISAQSGGGTEWTGVGNSGGTFKNFSHNVTRNTGVHENLVCRFADADTDFLVDGAVVASNATSIASPNYTSTSEITFGEGTNNTRNPNCIFTYGYILAGYAENRQLAQLARNPFGPVTYFEDFDGFVAAAPAGGNALAGTLASTGVGW